ncbi:MAG TPA: FAD-dependent oxidoreductase [Candidatus Krumholzibacteria bacterium]|nr:FAD-dependent oxidoreductase [Candidatus Krumholzibacteria bacterium]
MARIVVVGAGFAGHTAALYLGSKLGREHTVTVVNRSDRFVYIPSLVWVGIGRMDVEKTRFDLRGVYRRFGVDFVHGQVTKVHADERFVTGQTEDGTDADFRLDYDHLILATGPKLDFGATPGLGPKTGNSWSICNPPHALEARDHYLEAVARMQKGETQRLVIGTGHGGATCQGAALEYITNVHKDLIRRGVRDKAQLTYLSNERELGDFGIRGLTVTKKGQRMSGAEFIGAAFKDYGIEPATGRSVTAVDAGVARWEDAAGEAGETRFDYAMLIPRFTGVDMEYVGADGRDVSDKVVNPARLVKVDARYGLPYEELEKTPDAWPAVYQNPDYPEIFAAGIAFAPPGPISRPFTNPNGLPLSPAPPRTGMVSGIIGRIVALNVVDLVKKGRMTHSERMTEMAAACIASMGDSLWDGQAAVIMVHPVVPDMRRYPNEDGRDQFVTHMEMGLAGAWMKRMIHTTFMHKLQGRIGWQLIPE